MADECPVMKPSEGSEACSYGDMSGVTGDVEETLSGTWFLTVSSRRSSAPVDGQVYHISVDQSSLNLTVEEPVRFDL